MTRKFWIGLMGLGAALLLGALLLFAATMYDRARAGSAARDALEELEMFVGEGEAQGRDMATVQVGNHSYIGIVSAPSAGIELPVMATWSDELLRESPCRYYGTAADNNLVIAGFNYDAHFGRLTELVPGDEISLVEMDGTVDAYEVVEIVMLDERSVDEMTSGEFALTLFTRSYDGGSCLTVRCERV